MTAPIARSLACALLVFVLLFHPAIGQEVGAGNDKLSLTQKAWEGDADAQFELGCSYSQLQDHEEALKWFRKSAEQGHAIAQYNMGLMSANGMGVSQNHKEAVKWYIKAAEQGYAKAQCNLGAMHYNGHGVIKDHKEAVKWFHKAAEQGNATAQNRLGLMYYQGQGVPQDYKEAVTWYRMAAEQGDGKAQHNMGLMYYQGQGVIKDYVQTHAWYNVASANGEDEHASKDRDLIAKQMTQEQIAKAQKLAKEYFEKYQPSK